MCAIKASVSVVDDDHDAAVERKEKHHKLPLVLKFLSLVDLEFLMEKFSNLINHHPSVKSNLRTF